MDQFQQDSVYYHHSLQMQPQNPPFAPNTRPHPTSSQRPEVEVKDCQAARKIQKADREKLRRDRLNEQFLELGNTLDPDRPKNDKATILADTIQLLKDLTSQVNKLKAEYTALTEESQELTQEKNDLREEKASIKSDIENLNNQYQQRLRSTYPWVGMDPSVVMGPTTYPVPMPMPMPIQMQPYPLFGNPNPAVMHNPCPSFVPYMAPNAVVDQQVMQNTPPPAQPASGSRVSGKQNSKNKSSSNDVTTELELKTPGSTTDQDSSSGSKNSKNSSRKDNNVTERSSSSRCSSSSCRNVHESSSNSVEGSTRCGDSGQ